MLGGSCSPCCTPPPPTNCDCAGGLANVEGLFLSIHFVGEPITPCADDESIRALLETAFVYMVKLATNFFSGQSSSPGVATLAASLSFPCSGVGNLIVTITPESGSSACLVYHEDVVFITFGTGSGEVNPCATLLSASGYYDRFPVIYDLSTA